MAAAIRIPPHNIEAEQSVLGALMLDKEAIFQVVDFLSGGDFYQPKHTIIYDAMLDLFTRHEPIDFLSVTNRLKEKKLLDEIGGKPYLVELIDITPASASVAHYGQIVKAKRLLRELISAAGEIAELGYDEEKGAEQILDEAEGKIFQITQRSVRQRFVSLKEALSEAFTRIDRLTQGGDALRGVPTGFPDLDQLLSGLQKSDLVILAARPSLGKTTLALDIARNAAIAHKIPSAIFSLEMSTDQLVDRLLAAQSGVNLWKIRTGRLTHKGEGNDFAKLQQAFGVLADIPLYIDDANSSTVTQIRAMCRRLQSEHGLGLVIVDYLQLLQPHRYNSQMSLVQQVTEISHGLKNLARELNIPVLAASQLSRAIEYRGGEGIPKLSDLRESGSIEQEADVVAFIYREDKVKKNSERKNIADILVEKHRNGPT
ncbi:MAG: replicative DNA helicase, partial [Candidatus Portnoybacteria bacterium]|nr:replicative DNA helicase [Candidatus Portnoybacteria bacterium]